VCSLEVPDLEQSIRAAYPEEDVVLWLVNPQDGAERTAGFLAGAGVELPALLDTGGALYRSYPRAEAQGFAPYPVHVVIGPDGVIRYLAFQYDAVALRAAIDDLLDAGR